MPEKRFPYFSAQLVHGPTSYYGITDHYKPKPIVLAEHFVFYQQNQALQESVATYLAELKCLATHSQFGDFLESALAQQICSGNM